MRIQGRHEGSTCTQCRIKKGTLEVFEGPEPGSKVLRIEDDDNPAFWIDVFLSEIDLIKLLTAQGEIVLENSEKQK